MSDERTARAEAIRVARARLRLKQQDLADLAGLDQTTISKAELGNASEDTYDAIDRALAKVTVPS